MTEIRMKAIIAFYWTTFGLSIAILLSNIGLGLVVFGIVILPTLILHLTNGLGLSKLENHKTTIVISGINLLLFALDSVR